MVLFLPIEQELECISHKGEILGRIKFDGYKNEYTFSADDGVEVNIVEEAKIAEKILSLTLGKHAIPMQDDD